MKYLGLLLASAMLALVSCEKPPQPEIDAAAMAFQASAKDPDVITYAPDSLRAAQEKRDTLQAELDAQAKRGVLMRRYDAAKTLAAEAKAMAEQAATDAARAKLQSRTDAEALIAGFAAAIPAFEGKVWAARRVRGVKLDPDILSMAEATRTALADAQNDLASGAFAAAKAKALTIQEKLADGESRINEAIMVAKGR